MPSAIQHAPDPTFLEGLLQVIFVKAVRLLQHNVLLGFLLPLAYAQHVQGQLGHLPHLVFQGHLRQQLFHTCGGSKGLELRIGHSLF